MELLLLLLIIALLSTGEAASGVIWDKKSGNFVPIFSIPSFAAWKEEVFNKSWEQETHNFQGKNIRFTYFEITNLVNSEANGRVSGAIGEVWNILADHLNFTLKPILSKQKTVGMFINKDVYDGGLLQIIQFNKTDVIPRVEVYSGRLHSLRFTVPLWMTKIKLYIRLEEEYESLWMFKLFSPDLWLAILWMYFLISACSYVSEVAGIVLTRRKYKADLSDHLLYNLGMIYCEQSYLPESFSVSSCIVELCLGIFSLLIRTAFGALVFSYLSQITASPPFDDIDTLLDRTSYNVVVLSGSAHEQALRGKEIPEYVRIHELNRYETAPTVEHLYAMGCRTDKQYAILQVEDIKKAAGLFTCQLNPAGTHKFSLPITSGIARNFKYKRTIDMAIIKLYETGIMRLLRNRWIESNNVEEEVEVGAEPINMSEVYLSLCILAVGWLIAFVIFILENLIFHYYG